MELFAQVNQNSDAYKAGQVVGVIFAILLSAAIPIAYGASRGRTVLGIVGGVCAAPAALLLGCLGGLPVAFLFVGIIALSSGGETRKKRKRKPRRRDDEEDDYDRPRRSRRDDEGDEDDRPSRRRRDDD
jgi:hypothetical protein